MKLFLFIILIGMISCSGSRKNETNGSIQIDSVSNLDTIKIGNKIFYVDSIDEAEFKSLKSAADFDFEEDKHLINDSTSVKRIGDSLILNLSNGKKATFVNTKGEAYSSYRYLGHNKEINHFVVMGIYDEWSDYVLVNKVNGDSTDACGIPVVSPDKKFVICGNRDVAGFSINGFDFFELEGSQLKKIGRNTKWGAQSLKWKNAHEILVEIGVYDVDAKDRNRAKFIKMKFN